MTKHEQAQQSLRTDAELAELVARVCRAAQPDVVICVTKAGDFVRELMHVALGCRLVAASTEAETHRALQEAGVESLRLPLHSAEKYSQVRHVFSIALRAGTISPGELVLCAVAASVYPGEGDLVVLTDMEPELEHLAVSELVQLTDSIQPSVLESGIALAGKIGRAARRGKRVGAIFTLGDSEAVLENAKQLIPNPFQGHEDALRRLTNPEIHDTLIELAKLDGAFVVRGDGFIQTAAVFLSPGDGEIDVPAGLGARHTSAAAVTARTRSTAIVVSATDGNVRVFSGGNLVLQLDPEVPFAPVEAW